MIGTGAFWQTLSKRVRERKKTHADALAQGHWGSESEARAMVARISEIDWVLGAAADILGETYHPVATTQTADEDVI